MKLRIALLADRRGWAYDRAARALSRELAADFEFELLYVAERPTRPQCDLLHVFFWGETWHQQWQLPPQRVVKEISSHRWNQQAYGNLTPPEFVARHLADAGTLAATSRRLQQIVSPLRPVHWTPNGVDRPSTLAARSGPITFGWAGNAADPCKGLRDVLAPAAGRDFPIVLADGGVAPEAMAAFYRAIDVLLIASTAEGEPLTLLEAMAHGCYPIATDVGIVDECVRHGDNGLTVERSAAAFRAAMQWARCNAGAVRAAALRNAEWVRQHRTWARVAPHWRQVWQQALAALPAQALAARPAAAADVAEFNNGHALGQWPDRAQQAAGLVAAIGLRRGAAVLDLGCGKQTVRAMLPATLQYVPFDRLPRTPDTTVLDLGNQVPARRGEVALMLGLLEYLPDATPLLRWAAGHCRHLVFSFNDCSQPARRQQQHWQNQWSLEDLEHRVLQLGGVTRRLLQIGTAERLYHVEFLPQHVLTPASPALPAKVLAPGRARPIALFSAAVAGDNSGDALIEHAVRALLPGREFVRLPLVQRLDDAAIERANACELGILCGTNLYQRVFASGLDPATLRRLRLPLLPLGIGGSSPLGGRIDMEPAGQELVRELHARCVVGSVRDPQAYDFVRSLGIRNVELTGCPVLFANVEPPVFAPRGGRTALSLRGRLLHVGLDHGRLAEALLERLCRSESPLLVLQSPYDLPQAERLAQRHGLPILADPDWQAEALLAALPGVRATIGLRLHFNMLCLAHGIPAVLLGTDTRTQGFCNLMGLRFHDLAAADHDALRRELHGEVDYTRCQQRWRQLQRSMHSVLQRHGLVTAWDHAAALVTP